MNTDYQTQLAAIAADTYGAIRGILEQDSFATEPHLREVGGCYLEHGGKCLRPALLTFCCVAMGGSARQALTAGAAVEMFHTWTLMHDDVIDHDAFRRGRPTAHIRGARLAAADLQLGEAPAAEYGQDLAILGGDWLHGLAIDTMLGTPCPPGLSIALARRMSAKLTGELLAGEQMDIRLSQTPWEQITEDAVTEMMRLKTGALLAYCAEAGTAIALGGFEPYFPLDDMAAFASLCGLAFQMQDDILGIFGDETRFGKPIGSDIREGKRTLLMLKTLAAVSEGERRELLAVLGNQDAPEDAIRRAQDIIGGSGAVAQTTKQADAFVAEARKRLRMAVPDAEKRDCLEQWADAMVARTY